MYTAYQYSSLLLLFLHYIFSARPDGLLLNGTNCAHTASAACQWINLTTLQRKHKGMNLSFPVMQNDRTNGSQVKKNKQTLELICNPTETTDASLMNLGSYKRRMLLFKNFNICNEASGEQICLLSLYCQLIAVFLFACVWSISILNVQIFV